MEAVRQIPTQSTANQPVQGGNIEGRSLRAPRWIPMVPGADSLADTWFREDRPPTGLSGGRVLSPQQLEQLLPRARPGFFDSPSN